MAPNPKPAPLPPARPDSTAAPAPAFPLTALGPALEAAATAVAARTQAPVELAAHHVLTLAAMAAQRLVSLRLPTGQERPVSCFFATLAGAGERAGAAEKLIVDEARLWEVGFEKEFPMRLVAHVDDGAATGVTREQPLRHLDLFWDRKKPSGDNRFRPARRMAGLFARHPIDVIAPGAAAREEAASLCALWDGIVVKPAAAPVYFPRLSLHLVATPREGRAFLGEAGLSDCGLLARLLVSAPASRLGARTWTPCADDKPPPEFAQVLRMLGELYARQPTADKRILGFSADAAALWLAFAAECEAAMAPGGAYAGIGALADRLPEHAARLAAVLGLVNDSAIDEIGVADLDRGLAFARFYAAENLRLHRIPPPDAEEELVSNLESWLAREKAGQIVSLRDVYRSGVPRLHSRAVASRAMRLVEDAGLAERAKTQGHGNAGPRWRIAAAAGSVT